MQWITHRWKGGSSLPVLWVKRFDLGKVIVVEMKKSLGEWLGDTCSTILRLSS